MFTTNAVVEAGAPQHHDEYERGTTIQLGRINIDGTDEELGPRNLSHRTAPSLASDGRVIFTQWDHLGAENERPPHVHEPGHDRSSARPSARKAPAPRTRRSRRARSPRAASSRSRPRVTARSTPARSSTSASASPSTDGTASSAPTTRCRRRTRATCMLTPDVPTDNTPSANTIGRYYDAFPLNAKDKPDLLVSWADGPVESSVARRRRPVARTSASTSTTARTSSATRSSTTRTMWDIFARPLAAAHGAAVVGSASDPHAQRPGR